MDALFPTPPPKVELPAGYAKVLGELKRRIEQTRLATVITGPMGVADWETQLVEKLPESLKGSLPSIEEIEAALAPPKQRVAKRKKR